MMGVHDTIFNGKIALRIYERVDGNLEEIEVEQGTEMIYSDGFINFFHDLNLNSLCICSEVIIH